MTNGRDEKGRFIKGHRLNKGNNNGGRRRRADIEGMKEIINRNVSRDAVDAAWKRIESVLKTGGRGWLDFFKFYMEYRYGKPTQFHEIDAEIDFPASMVVVKREAEDD